MEFVGRKVKKEVLGFGICTGVVKYYNSETCLLEISYDNGDSEQLDFSQLASILDQLQPNSATADDMIGRKPKRRWEDEALVDSGNDSGDFRSDCVILGSQTNLFCVFDGNVNLNEGSNVKNALDLNVSLDNGEQLELIDDLKRDGVIDLNVNVNVSEEDCLEEKAVGCDVDVLGNQTSFDLNAGVEFKYTNASEKGGEGCNVSVENMEVDVARNDLAGDSTEIISGLGTLIANSVNGVDSSNKSLMCPSNVIAADEVICEGNVGSTSRGNGRKRRKVVDSANKTVLRRSARTARASVSARGNISRTVGLHEVKDELVSPSVSAVSEENIPVLRCKEFEGQYILPPKPQLPPSSGNLNVEGIPVFDVFSVYSFLRSFSTLLFLSPFELEDFVASLRCDTPTLLFDSIHLSLLQTLRKHLESLSDEGSESASVCLRYYTLYSLIVCFWE